MLTEELSELMIAVNKHRRNFNSITMSNLEGEIADTRIMIEQIIVMFTLDEVRVKIGDGTGAPNVIVNVDLYAVDGEGKPTGASLYSIGSINRLYVF